MPKTTPRPKTAPGQKTTPRKPPARQMLTDGAVPLKIHRRELKEAPYNPRSIDPYAARGLADNIQRTGGLIDFPIWNKRTGNIVGGHQRLNQLDKINGTDDYEITVAVIDVDETTEKQINVSLNNQSISGHYDMDLLDSLVRDPDFDFQAAGFDTVSLESLYLENGVDVPDFLNPTDEPEDVVESVGEIQNALDEADAAKAAEKEQAMIDLIKRNRAKFSAKQEFAQDVSVYVTLVFPTSQYKAAFCRAIQKEPGSERLDGVALSRFLDLDLDSHLETTPEEALQDDEEPPLPDDEPTD